MGNVLRVLGIVAASLLLGLVALFLLLFSICGGLESSEATWVLPLCLVLIVGTVVLIVFLGRNLAKGNAAARGLAVAPAMPSAAGVSPGIDGPPAIAAPAAVATRPFAGTDQQALIALRVALILSIVLSVGSIGMTLFNFGRYGQNVALSLVLRNILGLLPPVAVLIAVSLRNPPAKGALDAAAGLALASILFRFGYLAFSSLLASSIWQATNLTWLLLNMGVYSALEAAVAGLSLHLRSRLGAISAPGLIVATIAFLFWEGLVQAVMQGLMTLMF